MKRKELEGKQFGRLLVLRHHRSTRHGAMWSCLCACGAEKPIYASALTTGRTVSCGCYSAERTRGRRTHGATSGGKRSPEYSSWTAMWDRCRNTKSKAYKNYGGRGITVCKRWLRFDQFIADVGKKPTLAHTLERKNNEGMYRPSNCRWATKQEQQNNTRTNRLLTFNNETKTVAQWSRETGVNVNTLYGRLHRGWSTLRP